MKTLLAMDGMMWTRVKSFSVSYDRLPMSGSSPPGLGMPHDVSRKFAAAEDEGCLNWMGLGRWRGRAFS